MNLQSKITEAKALLKGGVTKAYISDKGRIKDNNIFSKSEKIIATLELKKDIIYVYNSDGKQVEPEQKRSVSKLRDTSDASDVKD